MKIIRHILHARNDKGFEVYLAFDRDPDADPEVRPYIESMMREVWDRTHPGLEPEVRIVEWEMADRPRYVRKGWKSIRPGDMIKDPRGNRVIEYASTWGYRLEPDEKNPHRWMNSWPKIGRMKVIEGTNEE